VAAAVSADSIGGSPQDVQGPPDGLTPSDCGCGCGGAAKAEAKPAANADCGCGRQAVPQLAYAFGSLDVDFGTEARRDVFVQAMDQFKVGGKGTSPADLAQLSDFLDANPEFEQGLTWVLRLDAAPVYAIRPGGTYAEKTAEKLRRIFKAFVNRTTGEAEIQLASFPGYVYGKTRLISGLEIPVLHPDSRGIYGWKVKDLAKEAGGARGDVAPAVENFLNRIYFEFRNLGLMPKDRALNYAATNAFQVGGVFSKALADQMALDTISVQKSPICRPEADCWDVVLTFFKPEDKFSQARMSHRFSVDVSDVLPVLVGPVRSWAVY
jgi:cyanobactin maturation PatA/PatG family protease